MTTGIKKTTCNELYAKVRRRLHSIDFFNPFDFYGIPAMTTKEMDHLAIDNFRII